MRCLKRNMTPFWYCLYESSEDQYDEYGNLLPEPLVTYAEPVQMMANISAATGQAQTEMFGGLDSYDKVIVTADMSCPIDEHTVLFIDKEPEYTEVRTHEIVEGQALYADDEIEEVVYRLPKNDYIVRRVAKSLNHIAIAVQKVTVS